MFLKGYIMHFRLPPLPYSYDALKPFISEETLFYHHDKHFAGYIEKTNILKENSSFENLSLIEIVKSSDGKLFDNAAQSFNHEFYFNSMSPTSTSPSTKLLAAIDDSFGSFSKFKDEFIKKASSLFGSGWIWLVKDEKDKVFILNTHNSDTPIVHGLKPLMVCDIWEHAHYLDYKNERVKYLHFFFEIINWNFASKNYSF